VVLVVQIGHATYWTSSSGLVVLASTVHDRTRWFGFIHALRNAGLALGGALGSVWLLLGNVSGLHGIIVCNAVSCVVAAMLLMRWRVPTAASDTSASGTAASDTAASDTSAGLLARASYAAVLRDGRYLLLIAINVTFVFAALLINVLLAIYIVVGLHRGAWIAGVLLVVNAVQVSLTQTLVSKRLDRYRATRVLIVACVLNVVSFGMLALLDIGPAWIVIPGLFLAMTVLTIGETVSAPPTDNLSVSLASAHARGRYLAVYQLSWTFGQITAPAVFTFLLARGAVLPLLFLVALSAIAVPMVLALERLIGAARTTTAPLLEDAVSVAG